MARTMIPEFSPHHVLLCYRCLYRRDTAQEKQYAGCLASHPAFPSVRSDHTSRLNDPRSAIYYLLTLLLQVMPYSLAVGAGVNVGIALFRPAVYYQDQKWYGFTPW